MKVLVLTRSMGEGHNRAARALGEAFQASGHECVVTDALGVARDGDPQKGEASAGRRKLTDVASRLYGWSALKAPYLFGAVYALGEAYTRTPVPSPIYIANARLAEATYTYIEEHEFDAVVVPHLFPQETLMAMRRHHSSRARQYAVATDYTCIPFFSEAKVDGYFIPHPDLRDDYRRHGIPVGRTVVTGLPVSARFANPPSQAEARASLGLPAGNPVFLVMCGGVGSLRAGDICGRLLTAGDDDMRVVVLTGRSEELFLHIAGRFQADPRVTVVPFTDKVPDYMAAADVMISKPGGVSSTEAAVMGVPLVHTATIPGVESKNARFFDKRGMSIYAPGIADAVDEAHRLMADRPRQQRMREIQHENTFPDSAQQIVQRVESMTG